jgi:hypothetical protein
MPEPVRSYLTRRHRITAMRIEGVGMANTAIIRDAYGVPAVLVGSKTGRDDARPLSLLGSES